jgi:hypothetical protein
MYSSSNSSAAIFQLMALLGCPRETFVIPIIASSPEKKVKRYPTNRVRQIYQLYRENQPMCDFDPQNPTYGQPELDDSITILAAILRNGERIIGQCEISHPGAAVSHNVPLDRRESMYDRSPVGFARYCVLLTNLLGHLSNCEYGSLNLLNSIFLRKFYRLVPRAMQKARTLALLPRHMKSRRSRRHRLLAKDCQRARIRIFSLKSKIRLLLDCPLRFDGFIIRTQREMKFYRG